MSLNLRVALFAALAFAITISLLIAFVKPERGAEFKPYWMRVNASDLVEQLKKVGVIVQKANGSKHLAVGLHVDLSSSAYLNASRDIAEILRNLTDMLLGKPINVYMVLYTPDNSTAHTLARWTCKARIEDLIEVLMNKSVELPEKECVTVGRFLSTYSNFTENSLNFTYRIIYSIDFFTLFPGDVRETRQPPTIYVLAVDLAKAESSDPMVSYEGLMYEPLRPFDTSSIYLDKVRNIVERLAR